MWGGGGGGLDCGFGKWSSGLSLGGRGPNSI